MNTKDPAPKADWKHPADNAPPEGAVPASDQSSTGGPPGQDLSKPANPDTRPLPDGWISEYSAEHKAFFYVNTKAENPGDTVTWTHPSDMKDGKSNETAPPSAAGGKTNPDTRPLPEGWVTDYDSNYNAWYYVNTKEPEKGSQWVHPAESQPPAVNAPGPAPASSSSHFETPPPLGPTPSTISPPSAMGTAAQENPDKRPLPTGWIANYDANYKTWYYVDTTKPGGPSSWEHPLDSAATSPPPAASSPAAAPAPIAPTHSHATTPSGSQNPDTRPLPQGWVAQHDSARNAWFYVNTTVHPPTTQWEHPAGQYSAPGAPPPAGSTGGLEGLLGQSTGKLVGGLFGSKGRAQMDTFANKIGGEINKYKQSHPSPGHGGVPPPSQYGAPPGQYSAPPGPTPGQSAPPPGGPPPAHGSYGGVDLSKLGGLAGKAGGLVGKFGLKK